MRNDNTNRKVRKSTSRRSGKIYKISHFISLFIFAAVIVTSAVFTSGKVYAKSNSADMSTKVYKSIMIYSGDSFDSIADKYISDEYSSKEAYVKEVISINNMCSDSTLVPGNHIIVPYYLEQPKITIVRN